MRTPAVGVADGFKVERDYIGSEPFLFIVVMLTDDIEILFLKIFDL